MSYILRIKRDGDDHLFNVPPGYDQHDPIIPQLNIYSRTLDTAAQFIQPQDVQFLTGAFHQHTNSYVSYQAFSCLTGIFRQRSDLFTQRQVWDLLEAAEDKTDNAFHALGIGLAESAVYSKDIKRTSPFLKHLFRFAAEGKASNIKNLAIHTLNEVTRNAADYIREYMFKRARAEILRSIENPAADAEVSRDYYAITGYLGERKRYQENVLGKKDQAQYDKLLVVGRQAELYTKEKFAKVDAKNRVAYHAEREAFIKDKLEIKSADQFVKILKIILNKNSYGQTYSAGTTAIIAGSDFMEEGYAFIKDFIGKGIAKDNGVAFRLLSSMCNQMPEKMRKHKAEDMFQFTVQMLPKLSADDLYDVMGWFVGCSAEKLRLKDVMPSAENMKAIKEKMAVFLKEIGGEKGLEKLEKKKTHEQPHAYHAYEYLAYFCQDHDSKDYPGSETHEKLLAHRHARWQEEIRYREERREERRQARQANKDSDGQAPKP